MGRLFNTVLLVGVLYAAYRFGYEDGVKEGMSEEHMRTLAYFMEKKEHENGTGN